MVFNDGTTRQIMAASAACMGAVVLGGAIGYSSPALRSIVEDPDANLITDEHQKSWVGSFNPLGAVVGALVAGPIVEYLGRRATLMYVSSIGFLASFLIIGFSVNIAMMYVGRFIGGAMLGLTLVADSLYIVETSEVHVRGMTGSFPQTFLSIGILFAFGVGAGVEWDILAFICCGLCAPLFICMFFVPESPVWLMKRQRQDLAEQSLFWLRQKDQVDIDKELVTIQATLDKQRANKVTWRDLSRPYAFRPFLMAIIVMFFRQFCGINAVIYFNALIFEKSGSDLDPNICAIIVGVIQIVGCLIANLLVDRLGRRILLLISFVLMGICVILLGIFFFWLEKRENQALVDATGWIPLLSLLLFILGYCIGIGPLSWTVTSEIIPAEFKSLCVSIANSFNWLMCFVVTEIFLPINDAIGTYSSFWMFGGFCFMATAYIYFFLPETKGVPAEEIRRLFDPSMKIDYIAENMQRSSVATITTTGKPDDLA